MLEINCRELKKTETVEFSTELTYKNGDPRAILMAHCASFLIVNDAILCGIQFGEIDEEDIVYALLTYEQ